VVARAIAALEEGLRAELGRALPGAWVRLAVLQALYAEVSRETGTSIEDMHTAVTRESTGRTVRTVWRMLLRLSNDEALVSRTPDMYKKAFSRGEVTSRLLGPHQSENVLSGWPDVPDFVIRQIKVATETVLVLAGRSEIVVNVERRSDGVVYTASWR
jgi:hypothetical protein